MKWEDENSGLCDPQNGFRKGRSTIDGPYSAIDIDC